MQLIPVRTRGIYLLVIPFKIIRPQEARVWSSFMLSRRMVLCAILTWSTGGLLKKSNWRMTPHLVDYTDIKTINEAAATLPLTSELIQISDSHRRDYHDNMNGKMFIKWITTKVILLAARNYPGVQIVLVTNNALYHHFHSIPSLCKIFWEEHCKPHEGARHQLSALSAEQWENQSPTWALHSYHQQRAPSNSF